MNSKKNNKNSPVSDSTSRSVESIAQPPMASTETSYSNTKANPNKKHTKDTNANR